MSAAAETTQSYGLNFGLPAIPGVQTPTASGSYLRKFDGLRVKSGRGYAQRRLEGWTTSPRVACDMKITADNGKRRVEIERGNTGYGIFVTHLLGGIR